MINFKRGIDPKIAMGTGIGEKIENLMSEQELYNFNLFHDVWMWALKENQSIVFSYLIKFHNKKWSDTIVNVANYNNELLWTSIALRNKVAVKCLLSIPNLFSKETFTLKQGTSELEGQFVYRGNTKRPIRATNFGVFINLAINHYPNKKIEKLLLEYYNNDNNRTRTS